MPMIFWFNIKGIKNEFDERNGIMFNELKNMSQGVRLRFITQTNYLL